MKKILKTFKAIFEILKNPWLLNNILSDESIWHQQLLNKYDLANGFKIIDINHLFQKFDVTLNSFSFLEGGSLPTDIGLLKLLAGKFENCSYFEIGTWRGESVINVSEVAEKCYTLNLSKQEIIALGHSEKYANLHGYFSKGIKNIKHIEGNSLTFDFTSLKQNFDLIFIDGGHDHKHVKNDTEKVFKHLIHDTSIIVWHDYAYNPEKLRPEVIVGILDGTPVEFRENLYSISNTMCAIFIRGQFETSNFETPITPNKIFKIKMETSPI
jgi:predicted O-methyltransferase YrrM